MDQVLRDQIEGVIRIIVPLALTLAASFGWVPTEYVGEIGQQLVTGLAAVVTAVSVFWSIWVNRKTKQIEAVANMKDVKQIVTTKQIANVDLKENPKVVANGAVPAT